MRKHLKSYYGFSDFRDYQRNIIKDILDNKDAIVIFPTGGGKSLCYQFPATYLNKKSIVISPLISLMTDQQMHLTQRGIKSICLNSESSKSQVKLLKSSDSISSSTIHTANVIYCTPEYMISHIEMFKQIPDICLIAIDEAHCLSEWGHDFRPSYRQLTILKKSFPSVSIIALTATATPRVLDDIFNTLDFNDANQYQLGTSRKNLSIHVKEKSKDILGDLDIKEDESTIIYTQTRKRAEKIHLLLESNGIKSGCYHAGMTSENKHKTHDLFIKDEIKVIVATICFGMGIDKPDIRKVVNYGSPCNLETYYQEIGRAGRDGMPSKVIMFYSDSDYVTNSFLLSKSTDFNKKLLLNILQKYITNTTICRQTMIAYYFDHGNLEGVTSQAIKCNTCDNCTGTSNTTSAGVATNVVKEARLLLDLIKSLYSKYGVTKLISILHGSDVKFSNNVYYTTGKYMPIVWWKTLIRELLKEGYLESCVTSLFFAVISVGPKKMGETVIVNIPPVDNKLLHNRVSKYKMIRTNLANLNSISPYMIINDKVMIELASKNPSTLNQMFEIDGISNDFICKYGNFFLTKTTSKTSVKDKGENSKDVSFNMYCAENKSISDISIERGLKNTTIESHIVSKFGENISLIDKNRLCLSKKVLHRISSAVLKVGQERLRSIKDVLDFEKGEKISYFQIKVGLLLI